MIEADAEGLTDYERAIIPMRGEGRFLVDQDMLACCALGLAEEAAELVYAIEGRSNEDPISELGDVLWYATTAAHRLNRTIAYIVENVETSTDLSEYDEDEDYARELMAYAGLFAGLVKKRIYHGTPMNERRAIRYIAEIIECARRVAMKLGRTLEHAESANIAKLCKRYSSGVFTAVEANARAAAAL